MIQISDEAWEQLIVEAHDSLPGQHAQALKNVAIVWQDEPTPEQRMELQLPNDQTLLGLYQGVPLTKRQGMDTRLPDKITLFRGPLSARVSTKDELREEIRHTLWHEIAHYYGLDHDTIEALEK